MHNTAVHNQRTLSLQYQVRMWACTQCKILGWPVPYRKWNTFLGKREVVPSQPQYINTDPACPCHNERTLGCHQPSEAFFWHDMDNDPTACFGATLPTCSIWLVSYQRKAWLRWCDNNKNLRTCFSMTQITEKKRGAKTAPLGSRFKKWCLLEGGAVFYLNNHVWK